MDSTTLKQGDLIREGIAEFEADNSVGYFTVPHSTWRDRLRWKLFPRGFVEMPDSPVETTRSPMRDCIIIRSVFGLGWTDRIRILLTGRIEVESKTSTENIVGACATNAVVFALPPKWMERADS